MQLHAGASARKSRFATFWEAVKNSFSIYIDIWGNNEKTYISISGYCINIL